MNKELSQPDLTRGFQFALDVAMLVLAFALAYLLRFEFALPTRSSATRSSSFRTSSSSSSALALAGVYSFIWRYVGMGEVKAFLYAALWSGPALAVLRLSLPDRLGGWRVPLSVILMGTVLAFGGVLGLRVAAPLPLRARAAARAGERRPAAPSACRRCSSARGAPACWRRGRSWAAAT